MNCEQILKYRIAFVFDPHIATMIAQLWEDPIMACVMNHSKEFFLIDSAP